MQTLLDSQEHDYVTGCHVSVALVDNLVKSSCWWIQGVSSFYFDRMFNQDSFTCRNPTTKHPAALVPSAQVVLSQISVQCSVYFSDYSLHSHILHHPSFGMYFHIIKWHSLLNYFTLPKGKACKVTLVL